MFRYIFIILPPLLLCGSLFGQGLDEYFRSPSFLHASLSVSILDQDGNQLYGLNPQKNLIPASSQKLMTTLVALHVLGPEHRFVTAIGIRGELIPDGTLYGDLIIKGGGDPSLGSPEMPGALRMNDVLKRILAFIDDAGITCIEGDIIVDGGIFDRVGIQRAWTWDDLTNYYAAGVYGLNIYENFFELTFKRSSIPGRPTRIIEIFPNAPGVSIRNLVKTGAPGSGDQAYLYGDPYGSEREVRGTIPPGTGDFTIKGAIPDPPLFFSGLLKNQLVKEGFSVGGVSREENGASSEHGITWIGEIPSPSLQSLVKWTNTRSNNLYCETFLKTLGLTKASEGTFENGMAVLSEEIDKLIGSSMHIKLDDGSGLSMRNRVNALAMTQFLYEMSREMGLESVKKVIPRGGERGMLSFLDNHPGQSSIWLKSGSMESVLSYAGIVEDSRGHPLFVSIISNGHHVSNGELRSAIEGVIEFIFEQRM
jgi:D-alanyl-D-alanine carboxypeptidase/D-alanyl-D-alanine-endopeptidase (penicillin-binding protein 4)